MAGPKIGAVQLDDSDSKPVVRGRAQAVFTPADAPGVVSYAEIDSLSNTRQQITPPSQCTGVEVWYLDPAGNSTGQMLVIVIDADSDSDANSKMAVAGDRAFVTAGNGFREFRSGDDYITRIDIKTSSAESNSNKIFVVMRSDA